MSAVRSPSRSAFVTAASMRAARCRPARANSAASSPPRGWWRADWRRPCRRCRARCRGSARTGPCRCSSSDAEGSMPIEPVSIDASSGEDVAEHVAGDDHVELLRVAHQLHGAVVDVHVRSARRPECFGFLSDDFAPELRRLEHVGLVDRAELLRRACAPPRSRRARCAGSRARCSAWCRSLPARRLRLRMPCGWPK